MCNQIFESLKIGERCEIKVYYCEYCKNPIENPKNGLVVKIREANGDFVKGLVLHKGECDDKVVRLYEEQGKGTNSSLNLDTLVASNKVERYRVTGEFL